MNYERAPPVISDISNSVETIYRNAVQKRISSSSEECVDISDETMNLIADADFIPDYDDDVMGDELSQEQAPERQPQQPQPSMSGYRPKHREEQPTRTGGLEPMGELERVKPQTAEEKAAKFLANCEAKKAKMYTTNTGKNNCDITARIDDDYQLVGAHLDDNMCQKIGRGEYVDFGKLLPKDRIVSEEDGRMELVIKNGKTFWMPVTESVNINNFSRWEQAFRIYTNVYTGFHPHKAGELIQYNHVIHSIAGLFIWDNVYAYDKEFRT